MVAANAQVYSVNVVGYVTVTLSGNNFRLLSVPLISTNTTLSTLIPNPAPGMRFWRFVPTPAPNGTWTIIDEDGGWTGDCPLAAGDGFFVKLAQPGDSLTITFVGEVAEKTASNKNLPPGMSMQGSLVPQAGAIDDVNTLNVPGVDGNRIWAMNENGSWKNTADYDGGWTASTSIGVADGFWYLNSTQNPIPWNRNFTVPQ